MAYVNNYGDIVIDGQYYREKGNKYIGLKWHTKVYKNQLNKLILYYPFYKVFSFSAEQAKEIILSAQEEKKEIEKHLSLLNKIITKQEYKNKYGNQLGEYLYDNKSSHIDYPSKTKLIFSKNLRRWSGAVLWIRPWIHYPLYSFFRIFPEFPFLLLIEKKSQLYFLEKAKKFF